MTGDPVAPEVPLEEVFFLTLLVYQTLLLWLCRGSDRTLRARGHAMTYAILSGAVLARWLPPSLLPTLRTLALQARSCSLPFTCGADDLFDNFIVGLGIVAYDDARILGWGLHRRAHRGLRLRLRRGILLVPAVWTCSAGARRKAAAE